MPGGYRRRCPSSVLFAHIPAYGVACGRRGQAERRGVEETFRDPAGAFAVLHLECAAAVRGGAHVEE